VLQVVLELGVLALLVGYLYKNFCLRHRDEWQRHREEMARWQAFVEKWRPSTLDTSSISPRLEQLRHDYLAAPQFRPHHSRLIASVREAILRLPYFRKLKAAGQASNHREPLA
jgi:hypothetical protein